MSRHEGSCHCGAIGFAYTSLQEPESWSVRACQCSFCRSHGALSTSDPAGALSFRESQWIRRYRFGQRTADFLLCAQCGVYIGAVIDTPRGRFGIINVNALEPVPAGLADAARVIYDSESTDERVARRETRWTPLR
jgi:hypothetical protein